MTKIFYFDLFTVSTIKGRNSPDVMVANKIFKTATEDESKKDHKKIPVAFDQGNEEQHNDFIKFQGNAKNDNHNKKKRQCHY